MYAEHTGNHFKLFCPIQEDNLFVNVYLSVKNDVPDIFDHLFNKYKSIGLSEEESADRAKTVLYDFFEACEETKRPFKIKFTDIDQDKFNS